MVDSFRGLRKFLDTWTLRIRILLPPRRQERQVQNNISLFFAAFARDTPILLVAALPRRALRELRGEIDHWPHTRRFTQASAPRCPRETTIRRHREICPRGSRARESRGSNSAIRYGPVNSRGFSDDLQIVG